MGYLRDRLLQAGISLAAVVTLSFFLMRLMPGGPVDALRQRIKQNPRRYGLPPNPTPEQLNRVIQRLIEFNPDTPIHVAYVEYLQQVLLNFNLGESIIVAPGASVEQLVLHAAPWSIFLSVVGLLYALIIGILTDTVASIPGLPLLLIVAAIFQPRNPFLVGILLNLTGWAGGVRGLRAQVIPLADEAHVEAARAQGLSLSTLLVKEILPHLLPLIFIGLLGGAVGIVGASVGLYFLGILPFTTENWGVVLNYAWSSSGALYSLEAAHWLLVPVLTILGLNMGMTLLAQAFDQVFNPRVRARHRARTVDAEDVPEDGVGRDGEPDAGSAQQVGQQHV